MFLVSSEKSAELSLREAIGLLHSFQETCNLSVFLKLVFRSLTHFLENSLMNKSKVKSKSDFFNLVH